ncbi:MAG TPA: DUF2911 domain-containing protein [Longimicrobiales bacterium]|nr:DUF2911 domain-containing protein [Longimicrobiales bacterium]
MKMMQIAAVAALVGAAACANTQPSTEAPPASPDGQLVTEPVVSLECEPSPRMPVEGRASPFDSASVQVGAEQARLCYGRPSARGREIFGGLVPYDRLWRTGANEPTILHLPFTADIAGLTVPAGSYSLYTEPSTGDWTLIINRSTSQWGHESSYTAEIQAQELGRTTVPSERLDQHVEIFTIRSESTAGGADLLLEWERTRVRIPIRVVAASG